MTRMIDLRELDLADIHGQHDARRALEIAAAGHHHLLLIGPPGAGKTMVAMRIASILPETGAELRAPLHTTSAVGMLGTLRDEQVLPGEVTLADRGSSFSTRCRSSRGPSSRRFVSRSTPVRSRSGEASGACERTPDSRWSRRRPPARAGGATRNRTHAGAPKSRSKGGERASRRRSAITSTWSLARAGRRRQTSPASPPRRSGHACSGRRRPSASGQAP